MRTANPTLTSSTFSEVESAGSSAQVMTLQGTVNKTGLLLLLAMASASWTWSLFYRDQSTAAVMPWVWGGTLGGLVVALILVFVKRLAPFLAPLYAVLQGFLLGGISAILEAKFPGIVIQAVGLTFGTLGGLLLAYTSRLIRPSENFKLGIAAATLGIGLFYLVSMVMRMFGKTMPFLHDASPIGIAISVFIVIVAALNLVLDFDFIEHGVEQGAPKHMEWYAAFGLLVTLVWLYLEILRLLSKLRSRR